MDGWVDFTQEAALKAFPPDLSEHYADWIAAYPAKAGRLAELVAETVAVFRSAVVTSGVVAIDPVANRIPVTGYRHALNYVLFNLRQESGMKMQAEEYSLMTRADIWLRMAQTQRLKPQQADLGGGRPTYRPGRVAVGL